MANSNGRGVRDLIIPVVGVTYALYKLCQMTVNHFIHQEAAKNQTRIQNCINGVVNIGLKNNIGTDFIGSGFFIRDDSFDGLVQKVKDKRNEKERKKNDRVACFDMIMTNFHVVEQIAKKIEPNADINKVKQIFASEKTGKDILLATGSPSAISQTHDLEKLPARVLRIDIDRDLALLSTRPPNDSVKESQMDYIRDLTGYIKLSFATKEVKVLDKTYVFGCPQKYASSATAGIISHVNRDLKSFNHKRLYQTDAAINGGNSGGPLVNEQGEVIAVATLADQRQTIEENINVEIPAESVQKIIDAAKSDSDEPWQQPVIANAPIKIENRGTVVQNINFAIPNSTIQEFFEDYLESLNDNWLYTNEDKGFDKSSFEHLRRLGWTGDAAQFSDLMDWASIHLIEAYFGEISDGLKFIFIKPESLFDADPRWQIYHHHSEPKYNKEKKVFIRPNPDSSQFQSRLEKQFLEPEYTNPRFSEKQVKPDLLLIFEVNEKLLHENIPIQPDKITSFKAFNQENYYELGRDKRISFYSGRLQ